MTHEQLRIFVAVAERQHVTQAAKELNLAQSAASSAVNNLEEELQARLFNRVGRGIELTEAGWVFLTEARAVLARADAARLRIAEFGELKRGRLRIHASQTIASYWLPRHLMAFRARYPGIEISMSVGNTAEVAASIHDGTAELGFVEGAVDDPNLLATRVAGDRMVLVVAPGHPWVEAGAVTARDLTATQWVLREPGSGTRSEFEAALGSMGMALAALSVTIELPTNEAVRAAVEASLAATVISASVAAPSLEAGLLHHVPFDLPERAFQSLQHRERHQSRSVHALLELIGGRTDRKLVLL